MSFNQNIRSIVILRHGINKLDLMKSRAIVSYKFSLNPSAVSSIRSIRFHGSRQRPGIGFRSESTCHIRSGKLFSTQDRFLRFTSSELFSHHHHTFKVQHLGIKAIDGEKFLLLLLLLMLMMLLFLLLLLLLIVVVVTKSYSTD